MKKKTGLNGYAYEFSVDYNIIKTSIIIDINNYLMKKWYKIMFGIIKKMFILLLSSIVNFSDNKKSVSLNNQKYKIQTTIINFHPNDYSEEFHCCPFRLN